MEIIQYFMKKFGLGKGLGSLIPTKASIENKIVNEESPVAEGLSDRIVEVLVDDIRPNPQQPRTYFSHSNLQELSDSIQKYGIIQPLIVTRADGGYELIAGERRLRAAKMAGLARVPVIVRDVEKQEQLEISLLENIQRHDLNPIEEAVAYKRLLDEFNMTQEELSARLGKSRPALANMLRLLHLPQEIQRALAEGRISYSAARVIVGLPENEQLVFFQKIMRNSLSVSDISHEAKKIIVKRHIRKVKDPNILEKEEVLRHALGTKVSIKKTGAEGQIIIHFYSDEELFGLCDKISKD